MGHAEECCLFLLDSLVIIFVMNLTVLESQTTISRKCICTVQGNIAKWRKKEGEAVSAGDVLCEIETVSSCHITPLFLYNLRIVRVAIIICGPSMSRFWVM
jgi:hypothetical protein